MDATVKIVPWSFAGFGTSVLFAQQPDMPMGTAAAALIAGFTLLLGTVVWIVKKQLETFPAALDKQQGAFTAALEKQNMVFAAVLDKVREDHQKTLKMLRESDEPGRGREE